MSLVTLNVVTETTTATVIQCWEHGWFKCFGLPSELYSDSDRVWLSQEFGDLFTRHVGYLDTTTADVSWQHDALRPCKES